MGLLSWLFGKAPKRPSTPASPPSLTATSPPRGLRMTPDFKRALQAIEGGESPLFITGNAGTGKSTLLLLSRQNTRKNLVVLAPTGIAALNVRGVTAHSFFKFPPRLLEPKKIKINRAKMDIFKKLDCVIIDEISMVRADLLDAVDLSLKLHRGNDAPFGGVQMVFFGDICQLPPVVEGGLETYFQTHYESPFFFSAHVLRDLDSPWPDKDEVIELGEVFRQSAPDFIEILNSIRNAEATIDDMIMLNTRCGACADDDRDDAPIVLTTTNKSARQINQDRLERLRLPEFTSEAEIHGHFDEESYPTEKVLRLRKYAQVMMIRNNGTKWVNGSIGLVSGWADNCVKVRIDGVSHTVQKEKWEIIDYRFNAHKKQIEEYIVGSFRQYPMKLAWSITIHKSQGQTFDRVQIDMNRGAFAHGQVYVALSRCKSLQGIKLRSPIGLADLCFDERVRGFIRRVQACGARVPNFGAATRPMVEIPTPGDASAFPISVPMDKTYVRTAIHHAMSSGTRVRIKYVDYAGNRSTRVISPIAWIDSDKFSAFWHLRQDDREFRVSRIQSSERV